MNILMMGGTNFIGPYICKKLSEMGHNITLFHRGNTTPNLPLSEDIKHIYGNRSEIAKFNKEMINTAPDIIIDMIAYQQKDMEDLLNIFNFATIKPKIILVSSADVYKAFDILWEKVNDTPQPMPVTEASELRSLLFPYREEAQDNSSFEYNYDKIPVENCLINSGYAYMIFRFPMVYGPGDTSRVFDYLKRMDDKREFILLGEKESKWIFSKGYVENLAHAIGLACNSPITKGIFNVADLAVPLEQWVKSIAEHAGWKGSIVKVPDDELPQHLKQPLNFKQSLYYDTSFIEKELKYYPVILADIAMRNTIEWVRNNPPSQIDPKKFDYVVEDLVINSVIGIQEWEITKEEL